MSHRFAFGFVTCFALTLTLAGCSSISVDTDYDHQADFATYKAP